MIDMNKRVIGKFELEDYQANVVGEAYRKIYRVLTEGKHGEELLIHAPVGSGKTVIASFLVNFLKEQMNELGIDRDFSFFWISPDTGGINQQSKDTFDNILKDVEPIDVQEAMAQRTVKSNQILFVNWEKIGVEGNKLMRETEATNFEDITSNIFSTKILIIDEAHKNWQKGAKEALELMDADIIINLTATPDDRLNNLPEENKIFIDYGTVQKAGIIKKVIKFNEGIDEKLDFQEDQKRTAKNPLELLSIEQRLILEAMDKRDELEELVNSVNEKYIKPLIIIQIPDSKDLEEITLEYVLEFLKKQGVEDEKIAVWLAEEKRNIEDLNNSDVEIIITKQAIATGWDCPRAHILVKLRAHRSKNFDLQTIGRIMRIPRGYNYDHEKLNAAYIYSSYKDFSYSGSSPKSEKDTLDHLRKKNESFLKDDFKNEIGVLGIPMYKSLQTKDIYVNTHKLKEIIDMKLNEIKFNEIEDTEAYIDVKSEENLDINDESMKNKIVLKDGVTKIMLSYEDLKREYFSTVYDLSKIMNLEPIVTDIIIDKIYKDGENVRETLLRLYTIFYNDKDKIVLAINEALNSYRKDDNIVREISGSFEVVEKTYLGEIKSKTSKIYSYDKEPAEKEFDSGPEAKFATFLNNNSKHIKYWFKNGTGKEDFSITYEEDNIIKEYYPDFIIFDNKDNMYILDTKANFKENDFGPIKTKFISGINYKNKPDVLAKIKDLGFDNLYFSMIKYVNNSDTPYILLQDEWSDDIKDWTNFENFIK